MYRKIILILFLSLFTISCSDTFSSVKRGLTGGKTNTADEFLVKKKDPLILPPDFENLPTPDERMIAQEEISLFEKKLEVTMEDDSPASTSTEETILKKIQSR